MAHHSTPPAEPKTRRRLAALAAVLLVLPLPGWAAACPGDGGVPDVRMATQLPRPDIRHALTRSQIGALSGHGHLSSDRRHAGLTQTQTAFTVKPTLSFTRLDNGAVCASLKQVDVVWRMTQFQVDVAAEYRRGSCPYDEILRHENQHVAIAERAFIEAEHSLRRDLTDMAGRTRPFIVGGSPQQAAAEMARRFLAAAQTALDKYRRDTERQNAAIDTPESYKAVSARCRDW